ncbi:MAG: hypothetical protein ABIR79_11525 [Candidatus Binatia bacterium]
MASSEVPSWIEVTHGSTPILLVAPHGGRRYDVRIPGQHKVNDLLTAELTRELASACGASTIVNAHLDRNTLDLNRVSQLRRNAPWMVDLLAETLARLVARHGHAIVLMMHGWNVTQAACDVGVGLREQEDRLVPVRPDTVTVSDEFVATRLRPLQALAAEAGIPVTIGSRYPAAHPNNALQMFRAAANDASEVPCPIATLCRRAPIEAAQLELAIPLRWPGPRRDRFVALLAEVFGAAPSTTSSYRQAPTGLRTVAGRVTERRGLQCVAGETLIMVGLDGAETGPVAGRVVVSPGAGELVLFTGELSSPADRYAMPPLAIASVAGDGARVTYDGPLVRFPTLTPFLDLERGLAEGTLIEGTIDLTFEADRVGIAGFGDVRGEIVVDGCRQTIAARGVATSRSETHTGHALPTCRLTLPAAPWGGSLLGVERGATMVAGADGFLTGSLVGQIATPVDVVTARARVDIDLGTTEGTLVLAIEEPPALARTVTATLERAIPVRRPGRDGAVVETTFALVRVEGSYLGWIEVSVERMPPVPTITSA